MMRKYRNKNLIFKVLQNSKLKDAILKKGGSRSSLIVKYVINRFINSYQFIYTKLFYFEVY